MIDLAGGRYRLDHRIAVGGMGEVWRATDSVLGRAVAVKLLRREYAEDETSRARFEAEARHAGQLSHPNIAAVFDFGEEPDDAGGTRAFLVMELVEGQPLSSLLRPGEPMAVEAACRIVGDAADAVHAAHLAGIVHRDIKPSNLLMTPAGQVKVTDFGIARVSGGAPLTRTGEVMGTPHYLAPEQAEGRPSTAASDVYSLGVVLYECLAGRRPFEADSQLAVALAHVRTSPPPLPDAVPAGLSSVCLSALAKNPVDRPPSAAHLAAALRDAPQALGRPAAEADPATLVMSPAAGASTAAAGSPPAMALGSTSDSNGLGSRARWLPLALAAAAVVLVAVGGFALSTSLSGSDPGGSVSDPPAGDQASDAPTEPQASDAPTEPQASSTPTAQTPTPTPTRSAEDDPKDDESDDKGGSKGKSDDKGRSDDKGKSDQRTEDDDDD